MQMTRLTKWLINIAALVIISFGMKMAAPMITQVLVILFLAIVISPIYYQFRKWRLPSWFALTIIIASMTVLCLYGANVVFSKAVLDFTKKIPQYHAQLAQTTSEFKGWLGDQDIEVSELLFDDILKIDNAKVSMLVKQAGGIVGSFLKSMILILIIVSFILCELPSLPEQVKSQRWMTQSLWDRFIRIVLDVRHYMGIKTIISFSTGVFIYFGLLFMQVDSPVLLGFVAFILNFVPVIGSIIAAVPAVLIAVMQYNTLKGIYVIVLYIVVNTLLGYIVEPRFMGYGFGVSPVVVMFSIIFWGWVLGPVGMLFAVPLTLAIRGALGSMMREYNEIQA